MRSANVGLSSKAAMLKRAQFSASDPPKKVKLCDDGHIAFAQSSVSLIEGRQMGTHR